MRSQSFLIMRDLNRTTHGAVVRVAFAIHEKLAEGTPVDTGWARANWQFSLSPIAKFDAENVQSIEAARSRQMAVESANAAEAATYAGGRAMYVGTPVAYVAKLDEGTSPQASAGWIKRAVDAGVSRANR